MQKRFSGSTSLGFQKSIKKLIATDWMGQELRLRTQPKKKPQRKKNIVQLLQKLAKKRRVVEIERRVIRKQTLFPSGFAPNDLTNLCRDLTDVFPVSKVQQFLTRFNLFTPIIASIRFDRQIPNVDPKALDKSRVLANGDHKRYMITNNNLIEDKWMKRRQSSNPEEQARIKEGHSENVNRITIIHIIESKK
uniref:Uncharacterized protein n=1 Tax=Cucumis melo TaxID=3656 RepID=A0A9I9CNB8_CUCME